VQNAKFCSLKDLSIARIVGDVLLHLIIIASGSEIVLDKKIALSSNFASCLIRLKYVMQ